MNNKFRKVLCQSYEPLILWLVLVMPVALLELISQVKWTDLRFHREQILQGEWWRLITGHLDHLGWNHWAMNAVFLALCLLLFVPLRSLKKTLAYWSLSVVIISLSMLAFSPMLTWYVGLSSSLYALLILGLIQDKNYAVSLRSIAVVLVVAKVFVEQGQEQAWIASLISGPVSEISHLYGVVAGLIIVIGLKLLDRFKRKAN